MTHPLRITHDLHDSVTISHDKQVILTYHYDADARYPYCHPVNLPDGPEITLYRPFDHDWHLGMYFSWKYLNGLNVWEGVDSGEPYGITKHRALAVSQDETAGSGISHALTWTTADGEPILDETHTVIVRPPTAGDHYCIDWTFEFAPCVETVVFERKIEWGGYAGLSVRFPRSFFHNQVLNADKQATSGETNAARSRWTDYSGWIDGRGPGHWGGVTMIDHPGNARHPTPWLTYDSPDLQFLNAAFVRDEPFTLRQGETLRLAYRVLVHWNTADGEAIEQHYDAFAATDPYEEFTRMVASLSRG